MIKKDEELNQILIQIINKTEENQRILMDELSFLFEKIILHKNIKIEVLKKNTLNLIDEKNNENIYYSFLRVFDLLEKKHLEEKNKENVDMIKNILKKIKNVDSNESVIPLCSKLINNLNDANNVVKLAYKLNLLEKEELQLNKDFIKYLGYSKMLIKSKEKI